MINPDSATPLYVQIKDHILTNIQAGDYPVAKRIPSERKLAQEYNVSRLTVSKAIQELVREGYLVAHVGKGTFVSDGTIDAQLDTLMSFTEEMAQRGQHTYSRVLHCALVPASELIADQLEVARGTEIIELHRVRMTDNKPVALEKSNILAALCPDILERFDFTHESLYQVLRMTYDVHMTYGEQTMEARPAGAEVAAVLNITPESPVLHITRVTYTDEDRPFEYVRSAYRGDRYKFRAVLRHV